MKIFLKNEVKLDNFVLLRYDKQEKSAQMRHKIGLTDEKSPKKGGIGHGT